MYTSLDEIINSLMVQLELPGEHDYLKLFESARRGLKELNFDTARHIKTSLLTVNSATNSVTLPADYVKLTKIGAYGNDGMIHYLAQRDDLYIGSSEPTGSFDVADDSQSLPVFHEQVGLGRQFGKGGGQNSIGFYRENLISNTIEFSSPLTVPEIIIEYLTDGLDNVDANSNVQIHSFVEAALRSYIYWNYIRYKRDYPAVEKQMAKKDYFNEKRLARARMQNSNKDQILVQSKIHIKQSPKI
tara:strand:+ start:870 stop:1601 length:732 start_codon:yes stop_codon:yes gene_type:complete